jgi:hypothetical protein
MPFTIARESDTDGYCIRTLTERAAVPAQAISGGTPVTDGTYQFVAKSARARTAT